MGLPTTDNIVNSDNTQYTVNKRHNMSALATDTGRITVYCRWKQKLNNIYNNFVKGIILGTVFDRSGPATLLVSFNWLQCWGNERIHVRLSKK